MAKKDFTANAGRVYDTIEDATAQEEPKKRRKRRTYTPEEKQEIMETLKTAGRKGCGLKRINMAFVPSNYEYITCMARVTGVSMTEFTNLAIKEHMEAHKETYKQAIEFRKALDDIL